MGEPCPDLPCFYAPSSGSSRLREAGRCHWRLPGLSSAPALPLHLGPRRPRAGLRGWWVAHCLGLQQEELCVSKGKGKCRAPPAVPWPPRLRAPRRAPGCQGPWLGSAAPHTRRLTPWAPSKCMTDVGSLALSCPAETCAGGSGLNLRVWVPAHSPNSGEAAPEARPAGGAQPSRLIGECTASREASPHGGRGGSPAPSSGKPCLPGAK